MSEKKYYSIRTGKNTKAKLDLLTVLRLFHAIYCRFEQKSYFQESFGFYCVDAGDVPGLIGQDIPSYILLKLRKDNIWPIHKLYENFSEDDLFDILEFLYDHISKPIDGFFHTFNGCGWHYKSFDKGSGQDEFRTEINGVIGEYGTGYELSEAGEILTLPEQGFEPLLAAQLPKYDPTNIENKVYEAIHKFRVHRSSQDERRDAVRALADVLEYLRPKVKEALSSKDENDLFNIANNFGIRHHNDQQKVQYDPEIWLGWMFYFYLATIHAVLKVIGKDER